VDASEHRGLAAEAGVRGVPWFKLYVNGQGVDYNGPRDASGLVCSFAFRHHHHHHHHHHHPHHPSSTINHHFVLVRCGACGRRRRARASSLRRPPGLSAAPWTRRRYQKSEPSHVCHRTLTRELTLASMLTQAGLVSLLACCCFKRLPLA